MKTLPTSEFKILLLIIRRTTGMVDRNDNTKRVQRAWMSQKLFKMCCNLSGRAVSTGIDYLVKKGLIEVTDFNGNILDTPKQRRGKLRLYFASRLRLDSKESPKKKNKACELNCNNPVTPVHTIKLTEIKPSCDMITQGVKRLSDTERYQEIQQKIANTAHQRTD
ncbi:hypothetical protein [Polaribacter cellanae]|uniref:Uncharacterized protein n=1 Tax=Polaribacter cellanae TaxID=2818493 RepID=A0A975CNR6_9FLAO|nr:hypothetical protein [Polaribacter cellanae]QTE21072.1 hypothetical protein J3359_09440 [Polaribacter cellanae]